MASEYANSGVEAVGLPTENLPYIYNPFFSHRADGVRGTGLGLSICKS
ncbi:MAG: sensor histidine kinase, partial [Alphaproteobacteria bacterium]|nr:sensor histidine kinase [Alphaproteobacteria bacterium]